MNRSLTLGTLVVLMLATCLWTVDAWARAGGGGSSGGGRGSRSYSAPARPSTSEVSPSRPTAAPAVQPSPLQRPGWGGMLGGLLVGGLIGSLLFGGLGGGLGGLFGGIGLLEILLIGGLAFLAFKLMRSRQAQTAGPPGYATPGGYGGGGWQPGASASSTTVEMPAGPSQLDLGLGHIRQFDAAFDHARFGEVASDIFFKVQAAWMARDMGVGAAVLTPDMQATLQRDCDKLRAQRRINRLENIAVRSAEITEAWQESGQDYVTVRFLASLLDFTTDENGTVVEGSRTEPVKFEEYWTFTRPVGPNAWRLSAIQQA